MFFMISPLHFRLILLFFLLIIIHFDLDSPFKFCYVAFVILQFKIFSNFVYDIPLTYVILEYIY